MAVTTAPPARRPINRPARSAQVSTALARREARFVVRHPLVLFGIVASVWVLWSINRDQLPHLGGFSTFVGMGLAPLAGAALLVGHLTASRAQRNKTIEIETTTPALQRSRTIGHLVGALVTVPVAAILAAAYMAYLYLLGGTGQPDIGELLVGPLVVGLGAIVGVTVGTWFPNRFSGLLGLGALAGVQIALQDAEGTRHWFAWWHSVLWHPNPDLWIRPTWAHLGYVAAIAIVVAAVAVLRHGARPMPLIMIAIGAVVAVATGITQFQPPNNAAVEARLARAAEPANYWVTVTREDATYQVHPGYERWVEWWNEVVQQILEPIPVASRPGLVFEQLYHPYLTQLEEEFGYFSEESEPIRQRGEEISIATDYFDRASDTDPWPIRTTATIYLRRRDSLATAVAQRAVGLPLLPVEAEGRPYTAEELAQFGQPPTVGIVEEDGTEITVDTGEGPWWPGKERGEPQPVAGDRVPLRLACNAEGQAREVIAAWLAAQASPNLADQYQRIHTNGAAFDGACPYTDVVTQYDTSDGSISAVSWSALGWIHPGQGGGDDRAPGVIGSPTATDLAAQLLELPNGDVTAAIGEHWDEWTDPATPIQVIIDEFDLAPPPTPEEWLLRGDLDPTEYAESIAAYPHRLGELEPFDRPYPTCP